MRDQPSSSEQLTEGMSSNSYANERHRDLAISAVLMDEWFVVLKVTFEVITLISN